MARLLPTFPSLAQWLLVLVTVCAIARLAGIVALTMADPGLELVSNQGPGEPNAPDDSDTDSEPKEYQLVTRPASSAHGDGSVTGVGSVLAKAAHRQRPYCAPRLAAEAPPPEPH